jgi:hypothetical protein
MWKLSFCLVAAPKLALYIALGIVALSGDLWDERLRAEVYASIAMYSGVAVGLLFLWFLQAPLPSRGWMVRAMKLPRIDRAIEGWRRVTGPRPATEWRPLLLASTLMRICVSICLAVVFRHLSPPVEKFYWTVFVIASLCVCFVEVGIVRQAMRSTIRLAGDTKPSSRAA